MDPIKCQEFFEQLASHEVTSPDFAELLNQAPKLQASALDQHSLYEFLFLDCARYSVNFCLQKLLYLGVAIDCSDPLGENALSYAAGAGHADTIVFLMLQGMAASPKKQAYLQRALFKALEKRSLEVFTLLLSYSSEALPDTLCERASHQGLERFQKQLQRHKAIIEKKPSNFARKTSLGAFVVEPTQWYVRDKTKHQAQTTNFTPPLPLTKAYTVKISRSLPNGLSQIYQNQKPNDTQVRHAPPAHP